jgi:phosphatidate cytidylyltransferase
MAGPDEPRGRKTEDEDLFEDLDEFFAPLDEGGWSGEGEAPPGERPAERPSAEEPAPESTGSVEEWDLEIEVPDEDELLVAPATGAATGEPPEEEPIAKVEPERDVPEAVTAAEEEEEMEFDRMRAEALGEAEAPAVSDAGDEPLTVDDLATTSSGAQPEEGEEEEDLAAADLFAEPETTPEPVDALGSVPDDEMEPEGPGGPEPEAVEAAAEHFATGLRESPEEVERELLSDLEESPEETVTIDAGAAATTTAPEEAPPEAEAPPPTWQEGAQPIEEPAAEGPAPPPGGRNLFAAFASGILLAIAVIALLVIGKGPFAVFASLVILLGQAELYAVMRTRKLQPATLLGLVCGALLLAGAYLRGPGGALLGLVLAMALGALWYMAAPATARRGTTVNVAATILGVVYVPFLASFALLLLAFPADLGRNIFLVMLGLTVLYDVIAYAVGTLWGNRPLAPSISPNKSWEGVIGATLGVLIVALAIVPAIEPFSSSRAVGLALIIAAVAPLGDLVESAFKRDLGVKDMGTILPGHGGILDRIDAILFTAPAAYFFLQSTF